MKVLQVNSVCGFGSTGRIVADLYKTLINYGYEGKIAYGRGETPKDFNAVRTSSDTSNIIHGLVTRITDKHGFGSIRATKLLIREIRIYDPDIIHLHNIHGYYLNVEILFNYLKQENKPLVWTLHDCWSFTGHCAHFDYIGCQRWKEGCYSCPQKYLYPSSVLQDSSKWNYGRKKMLFSAIDNMNIVTPSLWLESLVQDSFLSKYPTQTIYHGIDLSAFCSKVKNSEDKEFLKSKYNCRGRYVILGVASIWTERKGLEYLIELSRILDKRYQIIIVGVTDKQKEGFPHNVIGVTRTYNLHELAELYTIADVFVNPTLEEVLGLTNIEALACGTPVITFNTGGSPECIDETCGIVVEKGSTEGLIRAIEQMQKNPISSEACMNRARLFNKDDKFSEYIALYEQILRN